jgi:hypothetical protein
MRRVEAGNFASFAAGRIGRATRAPRQFGQIPARNSLLQAAQKVHSKLQISASPESGGKSLSQHSQFGRNSSMDGLVDRGDAGESATAPGEWIGSAPAMPAPRVQAGHGRSLPGSSPRRLAIRRARNHVTDVDGRPDD